MPVLWKYLALSLVMASASCTTVTSIVDGNKGPERLYYVLRPGDTIPAPKPLPSRTDIMVEWHYDDQSETSNLGFRGWDFDRDGQFDMVEVFSADGAVQTRIFDFNGDGVIDDVKAASGEQA